MSKTTASASRQEMPSSVAPMLAVSSHILPKDSGKWAFEFKWDGVRAVCFWDGKKLRLQSRNKLDITRRYPELQGLGTYVGVAIPDGKTSVANNNGTNLTQFIETVLANISNTNSSVTNVTFVVSANNFVPGTGPADTTALHAVSGTFNNAIGSSITANWYEDNGNHLSTVTGTSGSAPVFNLQGGEVGGAFPFTDPNNLPNSFANSENVPVNFTNPFSMTLEYTLHLTAGAALPETSQSQVAVRAATPLPSSAWGGLVLLGGLGLTTVLRRRWSVAA